MSRNPLIVARLVATPSAPTVTPDGDDDSASYGYKLVGLDELGQHTAASTAGTTAVGATTLSEPNKNVITWTDPVGATSVAIYRTTGGATQGLIGTVDAGVQTFDDPGLVADGTTAPVANTTGVGTGFQPRANNGAAAYLAGTFVGTVQFQVTGDGTNWVNMGSALTTPGYVSAPPCVQIRAKVTAYTSGTPVASYVYGLV